MSANKPPFDGEWVKLGELISKAPIERCGDAKYPVYSMTMRDGIVEQAGRFKKAIASKDTSSYKVVKKNQLVVGFPIDEGVIYVQNHDAPGIMSPAYNVWNIDLGRVDPSYLEFALHSPRSMAYYADKMRGTTARRRTLTADGLRAMEILLPSADGQIRVVNTLDEVRSLIEGANGQIAMLDTLVKSRFVEIFGSYSNEFETTLQDISEFVTVGIANAATHAYVDSGVVMLRNLNVRENQLEDSDLVYIDPEFAAKYKKKRLKAGDILVTRTGYPGIACVVPKKYEGWQTFTTLIVRLRDDSPVTAEYVSQLINSPIGKEFVGRFKAGSSQQNFGATALKMMPIGIPPLALQQEFAAFVAEVDKSRFNLLKAYGSIIALFRVLFP